MRAVLIPGLAVILSAGLLPAAGAVVATAAVVRVEARAGDHLVRVVAGMDEPAAAGSYDVRVYEVTNGVELLFVDGLVLPRAGTVRQAWFADLDGDGVPEIAIWTTASGPDGRGQLDLLGFDEHGLLVEEDVPDPAKSWQRGYAGHDIYRVESGVLLRSFPIYRAADAPDHPTGGERTLKLIAEHDRWMWRLQAVK